MLHLCEKPNFTEIYSFVCTVLREEKGRQKILNRMVANVPMLLLMMMMMMMMMMIGMW